MRKLLLTLIVVLFGFSTFGQQQEKIVSTKSMSNIAHYAMLPIKVPVQYYNDVLMTMNNIMKIENVVAIRFQLTEDVFSVVGINKNGTDVRLPRLEVLGPCPEICDILFE